MRVNIRLGRYGIDNAQYWPGSTGVTGAGMDIDAAFEDAVAQMWQCYETHVMNSGRVDDALAAVRCDIDQLSPHEPTVEDWLRDNLGIDYDCEVDWDDIDSDLLYHVELLIDVLDD